MSVPEVSSDGRCHTLTLRCGFRRTAECRDADVLWGNGSPTAQHAVMRVVTRQSQGRWALVAAGTALLCGLPAVIAAWPVPASGLSATQLRARILASAAVPYQGYAESSAGLGLPSLPDVGNITTLLDGTTDQYAWYRSASQWRADVLTTAGENDTYEAGALGSFEWVYTTDTLTQIFGSQPVRLPRAADLLPPALAQRLVSYAGPGTRLATVPAERVGGIDAAGLRLAPAGSTSTISAVDVWADPRTGLPVEVKVFGRHVAAPVLVSRFLDVTLTRPASATVQPSLGVAGYASVGEPDVRRILRGFGPPLPASLGGASRLPDQLGLPGIAAYGSGFSRFAVVPVPGRDGASVLQAATSAGVSVQLGSVL
ncbi:MAG TPA: hypothetical protein VH520_02720, partial [Streptosporangiaceae bacterium]